MEQMVTIGIAIYRKSNGKSIINLIFAKQLLSKSLISYDITKDFNYNSNHQPILFKQTIRTIDNPLSLQLLLSKIDILALKKTLTKKLAKNLLYIFIMLNQLNIKFYSLISAINTTMTLTISKAKLFPKLIPGFDKKYKKI